MIKNKEKDNEIKNWYSIYNNNYKDKNIDELQNEKLYNKTYENHYIKSKNVLSLLVGPSGCGKTTTIIQYIMNCKLNNNYIPFYNIIYFSASTGDEDLLKLLQKISPSTIIIDDINDLPTIEKMKNDDTLDKNLKNIIIFDDINNLPNKKKIILNNWVNSGRKLFSHIFFLCQNYIDAPINIRRNCNYIFIYKQRDNNIIDTILKRHNLDNLPIEKMRDFYYYSTKNKGQFLLLDLTDNSNHKIRKNFLEILY